MSDQMYEVPGSRLRELREAVEALEQIAALEHDTAQRQRDGILGWVIARAKAGLPTSSGGRS